MEAAWTEALAYLVILIGVSKTFGETFGATLERANEAVIQAFAVTSRYKLAVNLGVSLLVAATVTVILASAVGNWTIIPGSVIVAAILAQGASDAHDARVVEGSTGTSSPE